MQAADSKNRVGPSRERIGQEGRLQHTWGLAPGIKEKELVVVSERTGKARGKVVRGVRRSGAQGFWQSSDLPSGRNFAGFRLQPYGLLNRLILRNS